MTDNKQKTRLKAPRKLKKQIPKNTFYCYGKKRCKFWKYLDGNYGHCTYMNDEVLDSIKICNK